MHRGDRQARQLHAVVEFDQLGIVPFRDGAGEDVGQDLAGELDLVGLDVGQVHDDDDGAHHGGELQELALGELGRVHRRIGGAEVHRPVEDLVLSAAGADCLIVELDTGRGLRCLAPFGVDRRRKCGTRTRDLLRARARRDGG